MVRQNILAQATVEENAILAGKLLGDGHMQKRSSGSCRLKVEQSVRQSEYVLWLHDRLGSFCVNIQGPKEDNRGCFLFWTGQTYPVLNAWHALFYQPVTKLSKKGVEKVYYEKIITSELLDALPKHPLVLSCLFMDDGSVRNDAYSGKLAMHNYSEAEQLMFQAYLFETYQLKVNVVRHTVKSGQYYISVPASSFPRLVEIIEPWVRQLPSMVYKLNDWRREFSKHL